MFKNPHKDLNSADQRPSHYTTLQIKAFIKPTDSILWKPTSSMNIPDIAQP